MSDTGKKVSMDPGEGPVTSVEDNYQVPSDIYPRIVDGSLADGSLYLRAMIDSDRTPLANVMMTYRWWNYGDNPRAKNSLLFRLLRNNEYVKGTEFMLPMPSNTDEPGHRVRWIRLDSSFPVVKEAMGGDALEVRLVPESPGYKISVGIFTFYVEYYLEVPVTSPSTELGMVPSATHIVWEKGSYNLNDKKNHQLFVTVGTTWKSISNIMLYIQWSVHEDPDAHIELQLLRNRGNNLEWRYHERPRDLTYQWVRLDSSHPIAKEAMSGDVVKLVLHFGDGHVEKSNEGSFAFGVEYITA